MNFRLLLLLFLGVAQSGLAAQFPVRDAGQAIAIAKKVCAGKSDDSAEWKALLDKTGRTWSAVAVSKSDRREWGVTIPVSGPYSKLCASSYILFAPN
jgi:hypothetical protein